MSVGTWRQNCGNLSPENKLKSFIDFGGRGKEKPLSYSSIEKTFYSFFIYQDVLDTPLSYQLEEGENPRDLEKEQILKLMNTIAEEIYISRFDPDLGTDRIENKIQRGTFKRIQNEPRRNHVQLATLHPSNH